MIKSNFGDYLDTVQMITHAAKKNLGEDSFFCAQSEDSAIVCVMDGCGGLGARRYDSFQGHTGAYIASRSVAGAVHDWYYDKTGSRWESSEKNLDSLKQYIMRAYEVASRYAADRLRISGSMVRKFPTTLAMAYAEKTENEVIVHIVWAGDSRVYLLDANGLSQLTRDDTDVEDALENLISDAPMKNVLSADGDFELNYKAIRLEEPVLLLAATDGCFGYVPSPVEFEGVILQKLIASETPRQFRDRLCEELADYAGDDIAMGILSFNFGTFEQTKKILGKRFEMLNSQYLSKISDDEAESRKTVWSQYRENYEKYL